MKKLKTEHKIKQIYKYLKIIFQKSTLKTYFTLILFIIFFLHNITYFIRIILFWGENMFQNPIK